MAARASGVGPQAAPGSRIALTWAVLITPLLLHYASNDERVNAGWPRYEQALKAAHVSYQAWVYPGMEHGFNNDTTGPNTSSCAMGLAGSRCSQDVLRYSDLF